MKTKRFIIFGLAFAMMFSCMSVTVNAAAPKEYWAGTTFTFEPDPYEEYHLGEEETEGNIKNVQVDTEKSTATATITASEEEGLVTFTITPLTGGKLVIEYDKYSELNGWQHYDEETFDIGYLIEVGETTTIRLKGKLNPDTITDEDEWTSYKDIVALDSKIEIVEGPKQNEDCIEIKVKGKAVTGKVFSTGLTGKIHNENDDDWYDMSEDGEPFYYAKVKVVAASTKAYLDLDSTDATYLDKKDIDQNYTLTKASEEYTDVTKVKLEWTISDIAATYTSNKTWDPDSLTWKETKTVADIADNTATFKLTNYSSKAVKANVAFAVENSLSATYDATNSSFTNNDCTVATPVKQDDTITYQDIDFTALAQTITATLKFNKDKFADLSATTEATKYGTYTVTISEVPTVTWSPLSVTITTATSDTLTVNYLPVFADNAVPENITFAYKDGEAYTTIENPTMSTLASYANTGTLYYSGSGTLVTVRSVNSISWDLTFNDNSGESYPYYASTAYGDLKEEIKEKIASDCSETVEKLAMETSGEPTAIPTINGVRIVDIWNIYNSNEESSGFGGVYGRFLSCIAKNEDDEYYFDSILGSWDLDERGTWSVYCVLISRTFN